MSNRGGGHDGYEGFSRESHPAPTYGCGRGREGSQRGRGGFAFAPPPVVPQPMASSGSIESSLNREAERMSLSEKKPVVVTPGSSSENAPAPVDAPPQSSKSIGFPTRQGFEVTDKDLCHYDVAIAPETTSRNLNRSIISEVVKLFQDSELGGRTPIYDGRKSLYTAGQLPFTSKTFAIKLPEIDPKANGREKEFSVTIKLAAKAELHHLQQFLQRRQSDLSLSPQQTIHALDVVLRESPCTRYKTVIGRSFFSPQFSTGKNPDLGAGVEYSHGFYQSLRPTQMGLSLNIGLSVGEKSCQPSVRQRNMMRMKMVNGGTVNNWACLNFSQTSETEVTKFCDDLVAMCNRKGMVFNTRPCINLISANPTNLEAALRNFHQCATSNVPNGQLDLVIIIMPKIGGSYAFASMTGMIKKVFETELGIVSQCCAPKQVSRCNLQYLENISLKINVKVGGRSTDALSESDVTHPDPGEDSSPSTAAVVASMDWPEVICKGLNANLTNNERGQKLEEEENSFSDDELYDGANYDLGLEVEDEPMEEEPTEEEPTEEEPLPMEENDSGYGRRSSSIPERSSGSQPSPSHSSGGAELGKSSGGS